MRALLFHPGTHTAISSLGLLVSRVSLGLFMLIGHGWHKVTAFSDIAAKFEAGLGIPTWLTACAVFAEVVGSALLVIGLATRPAAFTLAATMCVATLTAQANNPWFTGPGVSGAKEPALLYMIGFVVLALAGAGLFSVDAKIGGKKPEST